jgi:hypothetical protein
MQTARNYSIGKNFQVAQLVQLDNNHVDLVVYMNAVLLSQRWG